MILDVFGYQFAPRYRNLNSDTRDIYGFHDPSFYKNDLVKPIRKINKQLLVQDWPNCQRIQVSLALKSTTPRAITRKFCAHPRMNQTKKAMWEFDNIIKSIYTL